MVKCKLKIPLSIRKISAFTNTIFSKGSLTSSLQWPTTSKIFPDHILLARESPLLLIKRLATCLVILDKGYNTLAAWPLLSTSILVYII